MLAEECVAQGKVLFRWRSYLPLVLIPLLLTAVLIERPSPAKPRALDLWLVTALAVSGAGVVIRILTVGNVPKRTSGRATVNMQAARLNMLGMYSVVRHPLYLGNFLLFLGFCMIAGVWWLCAIYVLMFWLYYERIMMAEEAYLAEQFGDEYREWVCRTPAFLPNYRLWQASERPFSMRMVLRREPACWFGWASGFLGIHSVAQSIYVAEFRVSPSLIVWTATAFVVYVVAKLIKKKTRWLKIAAPAGEPTLEFPPQTASRARV
ncbi:MAG: methyltransferase family protein [Planctomycetota bacterium]